MPKIPTIAGIVLVIALVAGVIVASESFFRARAQAAGDELPRNVEVTNVTDSGVTVSWTTEREATGVVVVQSAGKKQTAYDERDLSGKLGQYMTHSVNVTRLAASANLSVTILSNGKKHGPLTFHTGPTITGASTGLEPAYGTLLTASNIPADGALVYLTVEGGQKLSALVKKSGTWLIPLNLTRTADLTSLLPTTERMTETMIVRHSEGEATAVTDTLNDAPVPEMMLGKTYDFRKTQAKTPAAGALALKPSPALAPAVSAVLGTTNGETANYTVTLSSPKQNGALATTLPLVAGTGIPNATVSITLGMKNPISGSTKVGADGLWKFTPPARLAPGKQSVTITTKDQTGKPVAITHTFEIFKSGTQVLGDATPSAEPTLEDTPEPATDSGEELPTSGTSLPTILLILLSLGLFGGGSVLAFAKAEH